MLARQQVPVKQLFFQGRALQGVVKQPHVLHALLDGAFKQIVRRFHGRKGGIGVRRPFKDLAREDFGIGRVARVEAG